MFALPSVRVSNKNTPTSNQPGDHLGKTIKARLTPGELKLEIPPNRSFRVDAEGRWCALREDAESWQRTVSGQIIYRNHESEQTLEQKENSVIHTKAHAFLKDAAEALRSDSIPLDPRGRGSLEDILKAIDHALTWDSDKLQQETERFAHAYPEPVAMLPPDRLKDLVLLPAVGCPSGSSILCGYQKKTGFRRLSNMAFAKHVDRVIAYFGKSLTTRDGIFLGSGNALGLPDEYLLHHLAVIKEKIGSPKRGVWAFLDPDHSPVRYREDFSALKEAGLTGVVFHLGSASSQARQSKGHVTTMDLITLEARELRRAGIQLNLTIFCGGKDKSKNHFSETAEFLATLNLQPKERIYLYPGDKKTDPETWTKQAKKFASALKKQTQLKAIPFPLGNFHYLT